MGRVVTEILLIEDDPALADMYSLGLESEGYQVRRASTAAEGIRETAQMLPDVALIDIGLPDGSGFDVLDALAKKPGVPPIVAVMFTNFDDPALRTKAYKGGASGYVVKADTTPRRLTAMIEDLLDGRTSVVV